MQKVEVLAQTKSKGTIIFGFTWVSIGNLQPESLADRSLVKYSQPAFTRLTTKDLQFHASTGRYKLGLKGLVLAPSSTWERQN
eukprot:1141288-Pelagomonas_calceolata.AAC.2